MKMILSIVLSLPLILAVARTTGQVTDSSITPKQQFKDGPLKEYYLKKSENKKRTAHILLVSGTALTIGGVFVAAQNSDNFWSALANVLIGGFMMTVGITADLVSIPFFIRSATFKKKAASVSFGPGNIDMPGKTAGGGVYFPSVSVKIPL